MENLRKLEFKSKILNIINKKNQLEKIPKMGFTNLKDLSITPETYASIRSKDEAEKAEREQENSSKLSDQEILESTEAIFFAPQAVDTGTYEMKKLEEADDFSVENIEKSMNILKQQQKVISKKVLQLILDQRTSCNEEFERVKETEEVLEDSVMICKKARIYLSTAKKHLTTTSLEILATYKKREVLLDLLSTLNTLKKIKSNEHQKMLDAGNYSSAISVLLEKKNQCEKYSQYKCIESLTQKLQDTLILTEVQLDNVLNEIPQSFDQKKYGELLKAYQLLGKIYLAMDQLHMNFISAIHTSAFIVLKQNLDQNNVDNQKLLFEQMCENVPMDKYIVCLTSLCKSFWNILVCYYQVKIWHQNYKLHSNVTNSTPEIPNNAITANKTIDELSNDEYIDEKLKKGLHRIWNDIQSKICIFIASAKNLYKLKYENFIQILSIVQRLKKVGLEFCDEPSEKLMECMKKQSLEFFKQYHLNCLDEINLFLDHEIWIQVSSFSSILQLQEYRNVKRALHRHALTDGSRAPAVLPVNTPSKKLHDNDSSVNSQDESSIYGSCGYFIRFSEKSSPFDGGFDQSMLEEDILSGVADETSCYYSEESDNDFESNNNNQQQVDSDKNGNGGSLIVNNTTLNVLRCIGRYLQMCRLFQSIAPQIILSMTELIDFYIFAVYDVFGKDLPVPADNLYSEILSSNLKRIQEIIIPKIRKWPPSYQMLEMDLKDPEQLYGLGKRINGVESCIALIQQFNLMHGYLEYLILSTKADKKDDLDEREILKSFFETTQQYVYDLRKPAYMCVTARIDIQGILLAMGKIKWDLNHVTVEHSGYIDVINRHIQLFAVRMETIVTTQVPKAVMWDSLAHVITHLLVEGFANAKKCQTGGRALMQLDYTHCISVLDLLSGTKHPVHQQYVEQYVKAYYLPKDLLEVWITEQKNLGNYSIKHLIGLIHCSCSNDKKLRQRLLAMVENHGDKN